MANKISHERVKEIQTRLNDGESMNQVSEAMKVRRNTVSDIYNKRLVYCEVCSTSHDGPVCRTADEKRDDLMKASEDCEVCGKSHPMKPCPEMQGKGFPYITGKVDQCIVFDGNKAKFMEE